MKTKLGIAAVFAIVNLVVGASNLSAGWDDDVCKTADGGTTACCPECTISCECNLETEN